jgi:hypothetical protein
MLDGAMSEAMARLSEWRRATERLVSFAQANNLDGSVVQMALALDEVNDLSSLLRGN